jgi:hypothetical protein
VRNREREREGGRERIGSWECKQAIMFNIREELYREEDRPWLVLV